MEHLKSSLAELNQYTGQSVYLKLGHGEYNVSALGPIEVDNRSQVSELHFHGAAGAVASTFVGSGTVPLLVVREGECVPASPRLM